jgi:RHS repeat-associated protein
VPVDQGRFRPRNEGLFARIMHKNGGGGAQTGDWWEVWTQDGTRYYYGDQVGSRIEKDGKILSWLLIRAEDTDGNQITYYYQDAGGTNRYLSRIEYAIYAVDFTYEARPDSFTHYRAGFGVETTLRCKEILVRLNIPSEKRSARIRRYALEYNQSPDAGISLLSNITQYGTDDTDSMPPLELTYSEFDPAGSFRRMETDRGGPPQPLSDPNYELADVNADGLADVLYTSPTGHYYWLNFGDDRWGPAQPVRRSPQGVQLTDDGVLLADMDSDGRSDLLFSQGTSLGYWRSYGNREWEEFVRYRQLPNFSFKDPNVRLVDVNGDGLTDVIRTDRRYFTFWLNLDGKAWARPVSRRASAIFGDEPGTFFSYDLPDGDARLADMNGDGLQDLVSVHNGHIRYWPHRGYLRFASMVRMKGTPRLPMKRFQRRRFLTGDLNGDGFADLVYVDATRVYYWFNLHGENWGPRRELASSPYTQGDADVRLADMNGNGTRDLLWSTPVRRSDRTNYRYFDFVGGDRYPNLLIRINNNMGMITEITYKPVIQDYLEARKSGKPWEMKLPIAVKVVAQMKIIDKISNNEVVSKYTFHDGYYDGRDREFCGFKYAESRAVGDFSSPDELVKEYFDVGYNERMDRWQAEQKRSLRGTLLRREVYGLDGSPLVNKPYLIVYNRWESAPIDTVQEKDPLGRTRNRYVFFPYLFGTLTSTYERADTPRHTAVAYEYDLKYGTQTMVINYGEVAGWKDGQKLPDDLPSNDKKISEIQYAVRDDAGGYIVMDWKTKETDGNGELLGESENFYDGQAFIGLGPGQVTKGKLHRTRQRVFTPEIWQTAYGDVNYSQFSDISQDEWIDAAQYEYDAYGLLKNFKDAKGNKILSVEYDSHNIFPVKVTNPLGHTLQAKYEYVVGQITQYTDANGAITDYRYDKLGLVERVIRPGDSEDYPTLWYAYNMDIYHQQLAAGNSNPSPPYVTNWMRERPPKPEEMLANRTAPGNPISQKDAYVTRMFFDGLGRIIQTRAEAPDGKVLVSGWTEYNAKGKPKTQYLPFYSTGFDYVPGEKSSAPGEKNISAKLYYDPLEHLVKTVNPNGTYSEVNYQPWQAANYDEEDVTTGGLHHDTPKETYQDAYGRLIKVVEYATTAKKQITTQYRYDLNDNLIEITDATGKAANEPHITYDLLGRMLRSHEPNTGTRVYFYDENGNLIYRRDNKNQWIKYKYDKLNRLTEKYYWGSGANKTVVKNSYDSGKGENLSGRLAKVEDLSGKIEYSYDQRGRIDWKERQLEELNGKYTTHYRYDSMDRVTQVIYPNSKPTAAIYKYDEGNNLKSIPGYVNEITYNAKGQRKSIQYSNGVCTEYSYDSQTFLLDTLKTTSKSGKAGDLQHLIYQYDKVGNIVSIKDKSSQPGQQKYDYDALYRLTHAQSNSAVSYDITYSYDDIGNMIQKSDLASGTFQYDADGRPHTLDKYGNVTLNYDSNGNLEKTPEMTLHWDYEDRLVKMEKQDGTLAMYMYDAAGIRTMKRVQKSSEVNQVYYVDDTFEIKDGKERLYLFDSMNRIARVDDEGHITYIHTDHLGSTTFISDETGRRLGDRFIYKPYGQIVQGSSSIVYGFTGKEHDKRSGLSYHEARYYAPWLGRWTSADPEGIVDGLNLYAYVSCNPIRLADPSGTRSKPAIVDPTNPHGALANEVNDYEATIFEARFGQPWGESHEKHFREMVGAGNVSKVGNFVFSAGMAGAAKISGKYLNRQQQRSLILRSDILILTGHHWVESGGYPGEIHPYGPSLPGGIKLHKIMAGKITSHRTRLILVTGCNTLKPRSLNFFRKKFPNAAIIGFADKSAESKWTFMRDYFVRNVPLNASVTDVLRAWMKAVKNASTSKYKKILKVTYSRPGFYIPPGLAPRGELYIWSDKRFGLKSVLK